MPEATAVGVMTKVPAGMVTLFDTSSVSWLVLGPTMAGTRRSSDEVFRSSYQVGRFVARDHHERARVSSYGGRRNAARLVDLFGRHRRALLARQVGRRLRTLGREEGADQDRVVVAIVTGDRVAIGAQELDTTPLGLHAHRGDNPGGPAFARVPGIERVRRSTVGTLGVGRAFRHARFGPRVIGRAGLGQHLPSVFGRFVTCVAVGELGFDRVLVEADDHVAADEREPHRQGTHDVARSTSLRMHAGFPSEKPNFRARCLEQPRQRRFAREP